MSAANDFAASGRLWLRNALREAELAAYDRAAALCEGPGARLDLDHDFAASSPLTRAIAAEFPKARAVRALAFNKTEASNWGVPWHQDRVIQVAAKHDVEGFHNWSQKSGHWHCEPPLHLLKDMLFVRLHLDTTEAASGPMEIALGSHSAGILPSAAAEAAAARYVSELCLANRGDVLVLNMLTLHRSRPAALASTRRTLRIDFARTDLPAPLEWAA
jgi:hypothetical protein